MKKLQLDDFDKLLGLRARSGNPVNRIMGSFMGPLMRMMRVPIYLARVMFHVTTWRDPYLTFWVFLFLIALCFILIIFPWRMFFMVSSVLCLGPQVGRVHPSPRSQFALTFVCRHLQNILVKRYLRARAQRKRMRALEEEDEADTAADRRNAFKRQTSNRFRRGKSDMSMESSNNSADSRIKDKRGMFTKRKQKKPTDRLAMAKRERQPFAAAHQKSVSSGKKLLPRGVAIPYSRLKKDRFFDWPPDPTVSRATAIDFNAPQRHEEGSLDSSLPDLQAPATEGLRQRKTTNQQNERSIPSNIAF